MVCVTLPSVVCVLVLILTKATYVQLLLVIVYFSRSVFFLFCEVI